MPDGASRTHEVTCSFFLLFYRLSCLFFSSSPSFLTWLVLGVSGGWLPRIDSGYPLGHIHSKMRNIRDGEGCHGEFCFFFLSLCMGRSRGLSRLLLYRCERRRTSCTYS